MTRTVPAKTRLKVGSIQDDLRLEAGATVETDDSTINITGTIECEGDAQFKGDLTAKSLRANKGRVIVSGSLKVSDEIVVQEGSLEVAGDADARSVNIDQSLSIGGDLRADTVEVGGQTRVTGQTSSRMINVGDILECRGRVDAEEILVGHSIAIHNLAKLGRLDVGGSVNLAGGQIMGSTVVGGVLQSNRPLSFDAMDVGGSIVLTGSNKGGEIRIGGRAKVEGDLEFKTLQVSGRAEVTGSFRGVSADIGGLLEVGKSIEVSGSLKVGTRIAVGETLHSRSLELAGTLDAKLASVDETAKIGGMISTRKGLKASRIETASNWEVRGPLVADEVDLASNADAEDVYALDLRMGDGAKASNLFSARIQIGDNCTVTKSIEYTDLVKVGTDLTAEPGMPRKVKELPKFPSIQISDH